MDPSINGVDFVSSMPDEILHHILSFLPTRFAIRTTALSRRWRHVWCETPCLVFNGSGVRFHEVNQTLESYRASKITTFHLCMAERVDKPQIDCWIEFAMSRNVEKLSLMFNFNLNYDFQNLFYLSSSLEQLSVAFRFPLIPRCTVSWKSLRKLSLRTSYHDDESIANILSGCPVLETLELFYSRLECFDPSLRILSRCTVSWKSLRKLTLSSHHLDDESIANVLSGCPVLETLELFHSRLKRLDLSKSPSLRRLVIKRDFFIKGPLEIVAPHILYLKLTVPQLSLCTLVDVSSLTEASLHIVVNTEHPSIQIQNVVLNMLAKLQNVTRLSFTGTVLQILSLAELHGVLFPKFKIQALIIETRFARSVIPGIARLLQNSPELKMLIAQAKYVDCMEDKYIDSYLDRQGLNPDQCWRTNYEVFPTSHGFGLMLRHKDAAWKLVASFIEMVLRNVKALETLVVGFEKIYDFEKAVYEELLLMLPTLSNNSNVSIVLKR